jgi:hypothetical protein
MKFVLSEENNMMLSVNSKEVLMDVAMVNGKLRYTVCDLCDLYNGLETAFKSVSLSYLEYYNLIVNMELDQDPSREDSGFERFGTTYKDVHELLVELKFLAEIFSSHIEEAEKAVNILENAEASPV